MKAILLIALAGGFGVVSCSRNAHDRGGTLATGDLDGASMVPEGGAVHLGPMDPTGMTVLHKAADEGDLERTRQLLNERVPVDVSTIYGWTALHFASARGFTDIAELLLEAGASVDARTRGGKTAYHLATEAGQTEAAGLLATNGASASAPSFPELRGEYLGQIEPGTKAEPFAIPILAARHDHYIRSISFSPDGREAYWPVIDLRDGYRRWIESSLAAGEVWTTPSVASFSEKGYEDDVPSLSADGSKMLFLSGRPLFEGDSANQENIWVVTRNGDSWSEPIPLSGAVNTFGTIHQQVSLDPEDNLFFGAEGPGGYGSLDICFSRPMDGEYQMPVNLGPVVNGPDAEYAPSISPHGDYLIFTRNVDDGWTLFITFKTEEGLWTSPIRLDSVIEGVDGMNLSGALITRDGRALIFFGEWEGVVVPYWINTSFVDGLRAQALDTERNRGGPG